MKTFINNPNSKHPYANNPTQTMKTNRNLWMAVSVALLLAIPFIARSQNQVPAAINYQGRLTDTLGNPLASGYYEIQFRIWSDATSVQPGDLVWGRSFPLHVVTNGLFNILLTDDGGLITTPITPTNTLLTAFGGQDRYLGLTITVSNNVSILQADQSEISPRQQLASAPFAVQAQTANGVRALGVTSDALGTGSVIAGKIAANAVTSGTIVANAVTAEKIAADAVGTIQITNGAVTTAKLNIDADFSLNDHTVYLRAGTSHGLGWYNAGQFATTPSNPNGPVLFGNTGGTLATSAGGADPRVALSWQSNGVNLWGQDQSFPWPAADNSNRVVQAVTDGFIFVYSPFDTFWFQVRRGGPNGSTVFPTVQTVNGPPTNNAGLFFQGKYGTDIAGTAVHYPLRAGDVVQVYVEKASTYSTNSVLKFIPLGVSATAAATQIQ